jgi:23S rRNA pseudouridine1911/1915/1917 synthase
MTPEVLLENKDFVILNKPAGLLVHGVFDKHGAKHSESTLTDWLARHYPETQQVGDVPEQRGGIVHRLDRETSGAIVVARTQEAFSQLKKLFQTRKVHKTYVALVWGKVQDDQGVVDKPISIKDGSVKRTVFKGKMTREAVTEYRVVGRYSDGKDEFTLLEVSPKTGRTHQIRVHLSSIGQPVVGDKLYGKKGTVADLDRQFLHAAKIAFEFDARAIEAAAPLPKELVDVLARLKLSSQPA